MNHQHGTTKIRKKSEKFTLSDVFLHPSEFSPPARLAGRANRAGEFADIRLGPAGNEPLRDEGHVFQRPPLLVELGRDTHKDDGLRKVDALLLEIAGIG